MSTIATIHNIKITSLDPIPELAAYRLGFEAGGFPYSVQVTSEVLLETMMGLLKGELDLIVRLKGHVTTELVRAA